MYDTAAHAACFCPEDQEALLQAVRHLRDDTESGLPRVLVFGLGSYGDALQITPLLHYLRQRFPDARITLIHPNRLVLSLLAGNSDVDRIAVLSSPAHDALRSCVFSEALADLIVRCRYVVEYALVADGDRLRPDQREFAESAQPLQRDWLPLVRRFPFDNDELWRAAAARGWSMSTLMAHTAGFPDANFEAFRHSISPEDFAARRTLPQRYLAVCNSAEKRTIDQDLWTKVLPGAKFGRIVELLRAFRLPIVLLGASDDAAVGGVDIDLRGRTSIREAAAVLRDASAFVGPEGGLANLCRAVGTRSVIFFGSTPPEFFALVGNVNVRPRRCGGCWWTTATYLNQCPRLLPEPECTASVSEEEIAAGVAEVLS